MVIQAEQTLAAVSAATARTDALIDRINGITAGSSRPERP